MLLLKPGVLPPPKRYLYKCRFCGCEWVNDESELDMIFTDEGAYHYEGKCPTCKANVGFDYEREVSPEEYDKLMENVPSTLRLIPVTKKKKLHKKSVNLEEGCKM